MRAYRVISADGHTIEPPGMWQRYLPSAFQQQAPRLVKDPKGGDAWEFQRGVAPMPIGLVTTPGKTYEQFDWYGATYETINRGCFEGAARLKEQDVDGVDAEVLYPSQRTLGYFMRNPDEAFHLAGVRAYNNWIWEEYSAADRDRLIPMAQMPNLGIEPARVELRAAKERGFRGVVISGWPSGNAAISEADDPFWAEAEALAMPVMIHGGIDARRDDAKAAATFSAVSGMTLVQLGGGVGGFSTTMAAMIYSEMFDRFPGLTCAGVEVGAGWVPAALEHMDDHYWRNRRWANSNLSLLPSEYFHRNWAVTFITEPFAVRNRYDVGIANMLWSTDYPHHRTDWPYSRKVIAENFQGVPEAERYQITCGNAVRIYQLPQVAERV